MPTHAGDREAVPDERPRAIATKTKLFVPTPRVDRVARTRLDARLEEGVRGPLTLVCAAAGFGKTTLVVDWLQRTRRSAGWLSLDEHDNDPLRFLAYLAQAVKTVRSNLGAGVLADLERTEALDPELGLIELVNDVAVDGRDTVIVLDDLHVIESARVHEMLAFLIESAPPNLHMVVSTRVDPPWPLPRLRARGLLQEIRAADLRFTPPEAERFLGQTMRLTLAPAALSALDARTEGWIAGLQMAALSLRNHADHERFIAGFAGSHRFVLDYLMEEVLTRMDADLRSFLLDIAILRELTGPVVEAVTGCTDGRARLEALEAENLFLVPLDDHRGTYRFHHLFGSLLRHELEIGTTPAHRQGLHARASAVLERMGDLDGAFEHAIAAEDWDRAEVLLLACTTPEMLKNAHEITLARFGRFPPEELERRPALLVKRLCLYGSTWRRAEVEPARRQAVRALEQCPDHAVRGELALFEGMYAAERGQFATAETELETADRLLPRHNTLMRGVLSMHRAELSMSLDRFALAREDAAALQAVVTPSREPFAALWARWFDAQISLLVGEPATTIHVMLGLLPRLRELYGDRPPRSAAIGFVTLAQAYHERGELDEAGEWIERALELMDPRLDPVQSLSLVLTQVRFEAARDPTGTGWQEALRHAEALLEPYDLPYFAAVVRAYRVRLAVNPRTASLAAEPVTRAWLEEPGIRSQEHLVFRGLVSPVWRKDFARVVLARAWVREGEYAAAEVVLAAHRARAEAAGRISCVVESLLARAELESTRGHTDDALALVRAAVQAGGPHGVVGPFFEFDPSLAARGRDLAATAGWSDLADRLDRAARPLAAGVPVHPCEPASNGAENLEDALSGRELEVLGLVAEGLSNAEAGRRLFVAPSTIKKHLEHVYDKLGVRRRTQAVARARELGLL